MEKTWTYRELELREQIAKELEGFVATWHTFTDGIALHSNCWKCGTEPMTSTCDDARQSWAKKAGEIFANYVRNGGK
jgi:hypothetical protein